MEIFPVKGRNWIKAFCCYKGKFNWEKILVSRVGWDNTFTKPLTRWTLELNINTAGIISTNSTPLGLILTNFKAQWILYSKRERERGRHCWKGCTRIGQIPEIQWISSFKTTRFIQQNWIRVEPSGYMSICIYILCY